MVDTNGRVVRNVELQNLRVELKIQNLKVFDGEKRGLAFLLRLLEKEKKEEDREHKRKQ